MYYRSSYFAFINGKIHCSDIHVPVIRNAVKIILLCMYLEKLTIKIILLLLFSGHSQDKSQSDGPEIEQAQVQPQ